MCGPAPWFQSYAPKQINKSSLGLRSESAVNLTRVMTHASQRQKTGNNDNSGLGGISQCFSSLRISWKRAHRIPNTRHQSFQASRDASDTCLLCFPSRQGKGVQTWQHTRASNWCQSLFVMSPWSNFSWINVSFVLSVCVYSLCIATCVQYMSKLTPAVYM